MIQGTAVGMRQNQTSDRIYTILYRFVLLSLSNREPKGKIIENLDKITVK